MIRRLVSNSFRQIFRQPFRTLLVLQGVIWGTALGVLPPALIHGSMQKAEEDASASGIDRILITLERREKGDAFAWDEIGMFREKFAGRFRALSGYGSARWGKNSILAVDREATPARGGKLAAGRDLSPADIAATNRVCVLDAKVAHSLFGERKAVGEKIHVVGLELEIVGVLADRNDGQVDEFGYESGHMMGRFIKGLKQNMGAMEGRAVRQLRAGRNVMVPRTVFPALRPTIIEMRADPEAVLDLRNELRSELVSAGYQPVIYTNALLPFLYRTTLDTFVELNRAVFFLCILVGTSVVCVLMVLSVVERQREIAIRRVEGARQWHVALQFIVETGTICLVGALLGLPLGCGLAAFRVWLEPLQAVTWAFPVVESAVMVTVVTVIGLLGGLLPAWRAMRLDPVEVLRNE